MTGFPLRVYIDDYTTANVDLLTIQECVVENKEYFVNLFLPSLDGLKFDEMMNKVRKVIDENKEISSEEAKDLIKFLYDCILECRP